jgi:hypothetical protein
VEILTATKNKIKIRIENNGIIVWRFILFSSIVVINNAIKHVGNSIVHVNTMLKLDQYTIVYMGR